MLSLGLLVVHDTVGGGQDDLAELSGGKDVVDKLFEVFQFKVVSGRDNAALVKSAVQLYHNFA